MESQTEQPKVREIFGVDNFPAWLREKTTDWVINNRQRLNGMGISHKSITFNVKILPSGNAALLEVMTSLGVIPVKMRRPLSPQEGPQTAV